MNQTLSENRGVHSIYTGVGIYDAHEILVVFRRSLIRKLTIAGNELRRLVLQ